MVDFMEYIECFWTFALLFFWFFDLRPGWHKLVLYHAFYILTELIAKFNAFCIRRISIAKSKACFLIYRKLFECVQRQRHFSIHPGCLKLCLKILGGFCRYFWTVTCVFCGGALDRPLSLFHSSTQSCISYI